LKEKEAIATSRRCRRKVPLRGREKIGKGAVVERRTSGLASGERVSHSHLYEREDNLDRKVTRKK